MKCKKCGTEFEGNVCPNGCSVPKKKVKRPLYKKWWFWVLMGHATIFTFFYMLGTLTPETPTSTEPEQSVSQPNQDTNTEEPEKDPAQIKADYIATCEEATYKDIARYPDNYKGKNLKFRGKVLQVSEGLFTSKTTYRIEVTEDEYGYWDDPILVEYKIPEGAANILKDDVVTFYGECTGTTSYESVLGSTITIPSVDAKYIDIEQ